jgi:DNA-binding transcriptional regulator YhcF (GntR family)
VLLALRERIVNGVHFGRVTNDDRLPSARRLAKELKADVRVVAAAYDKLVAEGLVRRKPNSRGYYAVVERAAAGTLVASSGWLTDTLVDAIARGVRIPELIAQIQRSVETVRIHATCFECNDDQLRWLTSELERDYGFTTHSVDLDTLKEDDEPSPEMIQSNLLVTTAPHAAQVRVLAQKLRKPLILATLRMEIISEVTPLLAKGPVYFLYTDRRFPDKLRKLYQNVPHGDNAKPIRLGTADLSKIPQDAPVWVTQAAYERLGELPPRGYWLTTGRIFSPDTIHDLVSYLVRTNLAAAAAIEANTIG